MNGAFLRAALNSDADALVQLSAQLETQTVRFVEFNVRLRAYRARYGNLPLAFHETTTSPTSAT
jgi:hypothetical protein